MNPRAFVVHGERRGNAPADMLYALVNGEKAAAHANSDIYIYRGSSKVPSRVLDRVTLKPRRFRHGEQRQRRRR